MLSFSRNARYLFTSESVTEGHPDKVCDQISDAILDAYLEHDPEARVACETAITGGMVMVFGEVSAVRLDTGTSGGEPVYVDVEGVVRRILTEIGYDSSERFFDATACGVSVMLRPQSQDIARGLGPIDKTNRGRMTPEKLEKLGAGDQGMMVGYACNETEELMPMPISLAHRLTRRLAFVRKEGILPYIYPDGKSQVTVEYQHGIPVRVAKILLAAQHSADVIERRGDQPVTARSAQREIIEHVVRQTIPPELLPAEDLVELDGGTWGLGETTININTTGIFHRGGPVADAGLTGRKIIVDTYGGMARHGGGAFSGKDATKVDRSGSYAARYVAKNIVSAGLAQRCEVLLSYAIGITQPFSIGIETFGTGSISDDRITSLVLEYFDLRPGAIIRDLDLWQPIYRQTAAYGHFGRPDLNLPWERTDRAQALALAAS